jgi:hypothetical protein
MSITPTSTTVTQTITLTPGQQFVLPNGATVQSIIASGDATATSDCTIPDLSEYACSYFKITMDYGEVNGHPMDELSTLLQILTIGNTSFNFNGQKIITSGDGGDGVLITVPELNFYITDLSLIKFTDVTRVVPGGGARQVIWLYFQAPSELLSSILFEVTDRDNPVYFKVGTVAITCGETPNP